MATVTDVEVANASFPNVRQDLNDILEAITTNFSADAEPTTTYPNQFWYETDTNLLYLRNEANDAWITLASIDQTSGEWEPRTAVIQAIDAAGLSFKTDEGTTRVEIADDGSVTVNTSLDVDNIKIDGNTISSTDTNGDINITPDGTGKVVIDGLNYPTADGSDGQVLTTDGSGNIAFEDAAGGGITEADQYFLTSNFAVAQSADDVVDNYWSRATHDGLGNFGTGVSESAGVFTFPSTGYWLITFIVSWSSSGAAPAQDFNIQTTTDGSNFASAFRGYNQLYASATSTHTIQCVFDVTNTSTHKVRMLVFTTSSSMVLLGNAGQSRTQVNFIRLGDT